MRAFGRFWHWVDGDHISVLAAVTRLVISFTIFMAAGAGFLWLVSP